ncbi:MAG: site-specific integrase [Deltaproteobacteria bacterium]|nr:site-specific integrase [Deltaproteobacteria bacterium]MBW1978958.1 site-specific integrase [Deltaproteobacteria bacterium]MBW2044462.1 site-specific integrase [Deltaproteobacteria bacterium]
MSTVFIQKRIGKKGISYNVKYADPITGKKKHYRAYKRYKQAQWEANELRALLDSGKIPKNKKVRLNPLTFSEVSASLKKEWELRFKRKELSQITFNVYRAKLNVLERNFGERLLCKIEEAEILEFRDKEIEKNSIVSANRYLTILKFVFKHGLKLNALIEDPASGIKLLNEKEHERKEFLLPSELDKLIESAKKTRAKHYLPAIIYLGAEHGASKQEILSLRWSKINFEWSEKGLITFYRTKNKRERTEFLMPRTRKALLEWKAHLELKRKKIRIKEVKSNHVFCRFDGTPIKDFKKAWWHALEIAGIEDFHFHDLRHTFCSNLILSGASLKEVKEMIGHSDISMTDRYSHLSLNHKLYRQDQLAEHYSNTSNP